MIELLCVLVIIGILASLLLPVLARGYSRARGLSDELEGPTIAEMLVDASKRYCAGHPQFRFDGKSDFMEKCRLAPKCRNWVQASTTDFVPFDYLAPSNTVVLSVHLGQNHTTLYAFTKGDLSSSP